MTHMKAISRFLGISRQKPNDATGPLPGVIPPQRTDINYIETAIPAVFRSVSVLQTAAAQLSLDVWRDREPLDGDAYPRALTRPWDADTQTDLIVDLVASLAFRGNAYTLALRDNDGKLRGLRVLNPSECEPRINRAGKRVVDYGRRTYGPRDLMHYRLLRIPGRVDGLSPIQAARETFEAAHDARHAAGAFFKSGGVPTGIITTDAQISRQQALDAKEQWNERNNRDDGVAVMGSGMTYQPVTITPADAQFLESRRYSAEEIGQLFGVPPHLLGITLSGSSMTYQNLQDADLSFMRWTVMQYLREIENGLSKLLPATTTARFNLDAVLRPSTKTRYEAHKIGIEAGFLTPEYVAQEIEGLPPMTTKDTNE